ncbi:MAG TPA: hypothetical protein VEM58_01815 [Streptosporangiaceae bacterium]|nr:hypothetical protein [Streptosporangiaceae bacterium]
MTAKEQPMNKSKAPADVGAGTGAKPKPAKAGQAAAKPKPAATGRARQAAPERPEPPRSIQIAVRLMYAGAAVTVIGLVLNLIAVATNENAVRAAHKHASPAQLHATHNALITAVVVNAVIEIGAWLLMARANRGGLKWARIISTVLFALSFWSFANLLLGSVTGISIAYSVVVWLVGLGAIFFLWQKDSSAFFADASG